MNEKCSSEIFELVCLICVLCSVFVLQNQVTIKFIKKSLSKNENIFPNNIGVFNGSSSLLQAEEENEKLLAHISKLCSKSGQKRQSQKYQSTCWKHGKWARQDNDNICPVFYLPENNLVHCFLAKAGSTTIYEYLKQLPSYNITGRLVMKLGYNLFRQSRDGSPGLTSRNVFSFMFVRHPLDRLVSAFNYRFKDVASRMRIANYLPNDTKVEPTFLQFVNYFMDNAKEILTSGDLHFQSILQRCDPCVLKPSFIGKTETFVRDMSYMVQKANLPININPNTILNAQKDNIKQPKALYSNSRPFYAQLTMNQIKNLCQILAQDMTFFDYDVQPFLEMTKDYKKHKQTNFTCFDLNI